MKVEAADSKMKEHDAIETRTKNDVCLAGDAIL